MTPASAIPVTVSISRCGLPNVQGVTGCPGDSGVYDGWSEALDALLNLIPTDQPYPGGTT